MILATRPGAVGATTFATALIVRENGVLLTANHAIKNASSVQVRLKNGEVFDDVQLLGVDERRDMAALKINATGLPVLPVAPAGQAQSGDTVVLVSHAAALPWSASTGIIAAYRLADEVPGAGSGFRVFQFTAPASPGSSGGVLLDARGRALALTIGSLMGGQNLNFAVPIESVLGLADATVSRKFLSGAEIQLPASMAPKGVAVVESHAPPASAPQDEEQSEALKNAKDPDTILRNFKTMYVDAKRADYFDSAQLKAQLARNSGFAALNIRIVDDPKLADTVLVVSYTFAWDYPFELKHQNTSTMLVSGKGQGPFSGVAGAASVANQFVNAVKRYRVPAAPTNGSPDAKKAAGSKEKTAVTQKQ
jgi:hypothetical protein